MIAREQLRLKKLSDKTLLQSLDSLVGKEKNSTLAVLLHLIELDRRRTYLSLGFRSLFEYCTQHLKYSSSSAGRRIHTARCVARFPEIYELLVKGSVNLSTVSQVSAILNERNKDELLRGIQGKSQRQVERLISVFQPPSAYRDTVKPVRVAVAAKPPESGTPTAAMATRSVFAVTSVTHKTTTEPGLATDPAGGQNWTSLSNSSRSGSKPTNGYMVQSKAHTQDTPSAGDSAANEAADCGAKSCYEQKLLIRFLASCGFKKKYDEACSLLSNRLPNQTFEAVFEVVLDEFIDRHSPEARHKRREKRRTKKLEEQNEKQDREPKRKEKTDADKRRNDKQKPTGKGGAVGNERRTEKRQPAIARMGAENKRARHIPAAVRDNVFKRDGGKCTFIGKDNKRCNSTWGLEIDHIKPFARGGGNTRENLRLLCGRHNRLAAEKVYGKGFMKGHYKRE